MNKQSSKIVSGFQICPALGVYISSQFSLESKYKTKKKEKIPNLNEIYFTKK